MSKRNPCSNTVQAPIGICQPNDHCADSDVDSMPTCMAVGMLLRQKTYSAETTSLERREGESNLGIKGKDKIWRINGLGLR